MGEVIKSGLVATFPPQRCSEAAHRSGAERGIGGGAGSKGR